jgi:hypothetical protein
VDWIVTGIQVVIGLGIYNVWLLRLGKATAYRGGDAKNLREEFAVYGLPPWSFAVIGFLKMVCATLLLVGVFYPPVTKPAAAALGVLMAGAVTMHVKVKDPFQRYVPALTMLVLCVIVAVA